MSNVTTVEVPRILREPVEDYDKVLIPLLANFAPQLGLNLEEAVYFIQDVAIHQERVSDEDSKFIKCTIREVEIIERSAHGSDFVLGKKAILRFENQDGEPEEIQTGWIEYNGYNPERLVFQVSLANTIKEIAEDAIGKEVGIRKAFEPAETQHGGKRVRYAADIVVYGRQSAKDEETPRQRQRNAATSRARKEVIEEEVEGDAVDWDPLTEEEFSIAIAKEDAEDVVPDDLARKLVKVINVSEGDPHEIATRMKSWGYDRIFSTLKDSSRKTLPRDLVRVMVEITEEDEE